MMASLLVGLAVAGTWERAKERYVADRYVAPTVAERLEYAALVHDVALAAPAGALPDGLAARAGRLGLVLDVTDGTAVLLEPAGGDRGVGVVAVRLGPTVGELVVQAPHPLTDVSTGALAGGIFDGGDVRAVCIATVRRDAAEGSDPSRAPDGWLNAATQGLADALPDPLFVQLHGFGEATTDADLVVSTGAARLPAEDLARAVRRLAVGLGVSDVRTGAEVPALAGRGNAQGALLAGRARFLHLELSGPLRRDLAGRESALGAFTDVLVLIATRDEVVP